MSWMVEGKRYRVWYRLNNQRTWRCFVGTFLGRNTYGDYDFNLRPAAGTSSLSPDSIEAFRPTKAEHSQPVKVQNIPSIAEDETSGYQYGPKVRT